MHTSASGLGVGSSTAAFDSAGGANREQPQLFADVTSVAMHIVSFPVNTQHSPDIQSSVVEQVGLSRGMHLHESSPDIHGLISFVKLSTLPHVLGGVQSESL